VFGEGDIDLVLIYGLSGHIELVWEHESPRRWLEALGSFARVIQFDRRGTGLSDRVTDVPPLEQRMDDVRAVMDAAGSERAALLALSEGAPMGLLFAATYPERTRALVCCGALARATWAEDYPIGNRVEDLVEAGLELVLPHWGEGTSVELSSPSHADDPAVRRWYARIERGAISPGMLTGVFSMFLDLDVRDVVPSVHVPVLVLHRRHDLLVNVRHGRWLAEHLPDARYVELEGMDHSLFFAPSDEAMGEIEEFLTGTRRAEVPDRVLATVLFTDIVDSTKTAAALGDRSWRELLEGHGRAVGAAIERFGGRAVKSTGDGFLATFDGPARGIRCAQQIVADAGRDGLRVRAGLHTGECEILGDDIAGMAVHIAARVSALAGPEEVLVSRTVRDLVAGSGIAFADRGRHALKGVPDEWDILLVSGGV
jgi:class 3 adenylate cyclase